jgi:hypothetical protein
MVLTDPRQGERMEIVVDPVEVPQVRVWIDLGWTPGGRTPDGPASEERAPGYVLGLAPCIGAPDRLESAVLGWGAAQVLAPGEERTWALEVRLPAVHDESG